MSPDEESYTHHPKQMDGWMNEWTNVGHLTQSKLSCVHITGLCLHFPHHIRLFLSSIIYLRFLAFLKPCYIHFDHIIFILTTFPFLPFYIFQLRHYFHFYHIISILYFHFFNHIISIFLPHYFHFIFPFFYHIISILHFHFLTTLFPFYISFFVTLFPFYTSIFTTVFPFIAIFSFSASFPFVSPYYLHLFH